MKIVHLGKYFKPFYGGIETVTENICEGLSSLGHEVTCIVSHEENRISENYLYHKFRVIKLKKWGHFFSTPFCFWSAKKINQLEADIVHLHLPNPLPLFMIPLIKAPVIVTYHASILNKGWVGFFYKYLYRWQLRAVDRVVLTSEKMRNEKKFLSLKIPDKKITVIPIGINPPLEQNKICIESPSKKIQFIFTGRLVKYKGLKYMIEAMTSIDAQLNIVGQGPEEQALKALVHNLNLQEKIIFLGTLSKKELSSQILKSDLFVLPSTDEAEAFGVGALEAMSKGVPIMTTNINSGVAEINLDQQTGIIVDAKSSESISAGVNAILDKDRLRQMGKSARLRYDQNYKLDQMIKSYQTQYELVIHSVD